MMWPQAKECRWPLEDGKGKETDSPLESPEDHMTHRYPDFSLVSPSRTIK